MTSTNERKVLLSLFLIFGFMVVEAVGGVLSGLLALLADAGHMLTDAAAFTLAYAAFRFGRHVVDSKHVFGYLRSEVTAGFLNAMTLSAIVAWITYEARERLQAPPVILVGPMVIVAVFGLLVNVFVLWIMTRGGTDHVNVKGAILHVAGDLPGSAGAIVAVIVTYLTGWTPADPILSVLVAALILHSAWKLLTRPIHILLEDAPEDASPEKVEQGLMGAVPGLATVSHVHVWQLTSGCMMVTLYVRPNVDEEARAAVKCIEAVFREQFSIEHATAGIDWNPGTDENVCSLQPTSERQDHSGHDHSGHDHSGHGHGSHDHGNHKYGDGRSHGHDYDHSALGRRH